MSTPSRRPPGPPAGGEPDWARPLAGASMALQSLLLVAVSAFSLFELVTGRSTVLVRAITEIVLIVVFALGLAAVARGWRRGDSWPRTPTLLWCFLLLPVAISMAQAGQWLVTLLVAPLALAGIAGAWAAVGAAARD